MKKALVVFLLFAVSAGISAQGLNIGGLIRTGFAMEWDDSERDLMLGTVRDRGRGAQDLLMSVGYTSRNSNFGGYFAFGIGSRTVVNGTEGGSISTNAGWGPSYWRDNSWVWWNILPMLEIRLGGIGENFVSTYRSPGGLGTGLGIADTQEGFNLTVKPFDGLQVTAVAGYGGVNNQTFKNIPYLFGIQYDADDVVVIGAYISSYINDPNWTWWNWPGRPMQEARSNSFSLGAAYTGLRGIGLSWIGLDFIGEDFGEEVNRSHIGFGIRVDYTQPESEIFFTSLMVQQLLWTGDYDLTIGGNRHYTGYGDAGFFTEGFGIQGSLEYRPLDFLAAGFEARYITGAVQDTRYSRTWIAPEQGWGWFNKDQAALGVSPYIKLTASIGSLLPDIWIGYNVNVDLSQDVTASTAVDRDGSGNNRDYTIKHLFYIALSVSY